MRPPSTGISWAALNQTVCALRFFFGVTLGPASGERIATPASRSKLPVVLSPDEVVRFLEAVARPEASGRADDRLCRGAAGVRGGSPEGRRHRQRRMVIRVEHGKGGKDRYVMLSPQLLGILRAYWQRARPAAGCFPAASRRSRSTSSGCSRACRAAAAAAGIAKRVTVHTLRHSFATHLLEQKAPTSGSSRCCSKQRHTARQHEVEGRIYYPFHPRCGEAVLIVRQFAYRGTELVVIPQPDDSIACIPAWMTHESAAHHQAACRAAAFP